MISALIAILAAAISAEAAPQILAQAPVKTGAHKPVVVDPKWEAMPNGDDFADRYPVAALGANISGAATLHCLVHINGDLYDCKAIREEPAGWGFGDASEALAANFKMRPKTVDGVPVDGAEVKFTINWSMPSRAETVTDKPPPTLAEAEARDAEAHALARKIAAVDADFGGWSRMIRTSYQYLFIPLFGAADKARAAAFGKSFQQAYNEYDAERRDRLAASMVFVFSREELKSIADFMETPAGAAFARKYPVAMAKSYGHSQELWLALVEAWQVRYCAEIACNDADLGGFEKLRSGPSSQRPPLEPPKAAPDDKSGKDGKGPKDDRGG
jgi:hypothetical protein